ncbi:MAG: substrate-binding domain-containing protein [Desulfitobacteriia bacterium]
MKTKKYLLLSSLLSLLLILTFMVGCSQQSETPAGPENPNVILATTTSTQDSGLLDELLPIFEEQTGYKVKTIAVGTGAALEMGKKGEADVLLTHAPSSEQPLVEDGSVINYQLVMHNDFIIVGPPNDPAKIKEAKDLSAAFKAIADTKSVFISRGDDSGTHKKELDLWKKAGIDPAGDWYQEAGAGMGQTLTITSEKRGYTLTDRATYLAFKDQIELEIVLEGAKELLNIYHVMQVNPEKHPDLSTPINAEGAKAFVEFMISADTQKIIENFGKDTYGESLFTPDAGKSMDELGG